MEYKKRIADKLLKEKLEAMGAVLIEGPKFCGKTTLAVQQAKSILYMSDPDSIAQNLRLARTSIKLLLEGETPRLIDEWQLAPQFWDAVRNEVDRRGEDGQFMLTGSAVPPDPKREEDMIHHTGTGRIARLKLRTMSLWESGESSGQVSLSSLFAGKGGIEGKNDLDLHTVAFLTCRGGWPKAVLKKNERPSLMQVEEYYESVVNADISRVDDVGRDPDLARKIMRSYARNQGTQATVATLLHDVQAGSGKSMSENTAYGYINALRRIFVIEDALAWNPNLRSRTAVRTSETRYFADPSIAVAALGLGPLDLMNDLDTFGLFFESLAIRDLRVYADAIGGTVYHYRDRNNLECDAVVHLKNGSYGLVEVKLGGARYIDEGAANLKALADKIDTTKMPGPSFMMVLTGIGEYAYEREDGVAVVPVGCLKD